MGFSPHSKWLNRTTYIVFCRGRKSYVYLTRHHFSLLKICEGEGAMSIYQDIALNCSGCAMESRLCRNWVLRLSPLIWSKKRRSSCRFWCIFAIMAQPGGGGEGDASRRSSLPSRFLKRSEYPRRPVTTPGV